MARIVTIHSSPETRIPPSEVSEEEVEALEAAITDFVDSHSSISWDGFYASEDGIGIAEWDAPASETETIESFTNDLEGVSMDAVVAVERAPIL